MKRATIFPVALALTPGSACPAFADQPGADWMPADQVKQKPVDAGYTSLTEPEADDGHWEGEGIKGGVTMEFHVDPKSRSQDRSGHGGEA